MLFLGTASVFPASPPSTYPPAPGQVLAPSGAESDARKSLFEGKAEEALRLLLAAQPEPAFEHGRRVGERVVTIAAPDEIRFVVEAFFGERLSQSQDVRQRLIFNNHFFRRRAARLLRFADDERDHVAVK